MLLAGNKVLLGPFVRRKEQHSDGSDKKFTGVFIENFGDELTEASLHTTFSEFGEITSSRVMTDETGKAKGFGFVFFKQPESAEAAVNALNGKDVNGKTLFVGRAQKNGERQAELRDKFERQKQERMNRYQTGVNLYVKNLDETIDDEKLRAEFAPFGNITSARVTVDSTGRSKGFGFVCFVAPEEATKAVTEMNGKIVVSKPLYVALAQRKEDRKAHLASKYMQRLASYRMQGQLPSQFMPPAQATGYFVPTMQQPLSFYNPLAGPSFNWRPTSSRQTTSNTQGLRGASQGALVGKSAGVSDSNSDSPTPKSSLTSPSRSPIESCVSLEMKPGDGTVTDRTLQDMSSSRETGRSSIVSKEASGTAVMTDCVPDSATEGATSMMAAEVAATSRASQRSGRGGLKSQASQTEPVGARQESTWQLASSQCAASAAAASKCLISGLKQTNSHLEKQLQEKQSELDNALEDFGGTRAKLSEFLEQTKERQCQFNEMKLQAAEKELAMQQLRQELLRMRSVEDELNRRCVESDQTLQRALTNAEQDQQRMEDKLQKLKSKSDAQVEALVVNATVLELMAAQETQLKEVISDLNERLKLMDEENVRKLSEASRKQDQLFSWMCDQSEQRIRAEQQLKQANQLLGQTVERLEEAETFAADIQDDSASQETEIQTLKLQLQESIEKRDDVIDIAEELRARLEAELQRADKLASELSGLKLEHSKMMSRARELLPQLAQTQLRLRQAEEAIDAYKKGVSS